MAEEFMTRKELAELLKTTVRTIERFYTEEGMPYIKFGRMIRFEKKEVLDWIRKHKQTEMR